MLRYLKHTKSYIHHLDDYNALSQECWLSSIYCFFTGTRKIILIMACEEKSFAVCVNDAMTFQTKLNYWTEMNCVFSMDYRVYCIYHLLRGYFSQRKNPFVNVNHLEEIYKKDTSLKISSCNVFHNLCFIRYFLFLYILESILNLYYLVLSSAIMLERKYLIEKYFVFLLLNSYIRIISA